MISESQLLLENVDLAFGQHREQTADGRVFIAFKKFKDRSSKRVSVSAFDYFAHEFEFENGMKLLEDITLEASLSLDSIEAKFGNTVQVVDVEEEIFEDDVKKGVPNGNKKPRERLVFEEE